MSNPFDDLKADDEGTADDEEAGETDATADTATEVDTEPTSGQAAEVASNPPSTDSGTSNESASESSIDVEAGSERATETPDEPVSPAETGPAFEYSEVKQKPFYARTETVNDFENAIRTTIVPKLAEANVIDEETREIHDAVLRLANEEPERIAELVLEERRRAGNQ